MKTLEGYLREHLLELCARIGSRHVGSPGEAKAAAYIERAFNAAGYEVVRESFPVTGWECRSFSLIDMSIGEELFMAPCFFSNTVEIEERPLWLGPDAVEALEKQPVKGRLCVIDVATDTGKVFSRNRIAEHLDELGAAAAIFVSEHYDAINTKIQRSPFLETLGTASVSGRTLARLAANPDRVYRLVIDATKFDTTSDNVIARLPGDGARAVFGAHYDTAPLIQGASDNASGTAALLEVARLLREKSHGRALDFVAFSAEEYVPHSPPPPGSADYVRRHGSDNLGWYMNFDSIGRYGARDVLQVGFPEKLPPLTQSAIPLVDYSGSGDDTAFHAIDLPTLWYYSASPFKLIHTAEDHYRNIDHEKLAKIVLDAVAVADSLLV